MSPGRRVGTRNCSTQAWNRHPLIGPSNTQGAVMPLARSPARNVMVDQRMNGTAATRRSPCVAQPRVRVMLVLAQVSSTKISRSGSTRPWYRFQRSRLRATSGRSCSAARRLFFEGQARVAKKTPNGVIADFGATVGQLRTQGTHGRIRNGRNPREQPITLGKQNSVTSAAHWLGCARARGPLAIDPAHDGCRAKIKKPGNSTPRLARINGSHNAFTQVHRVGLGHRC